MQLRTLLLVTTALAAAVCGASAKGGRRRRRSPGPPPKPPPHPHPAGCKSAADCSGNGVCASATTCRCDPAWAGDKCQTMHLVPGSVTSGLRQIDVPADGAGAPNNGSTIPGNTSTWGGATVFDPATKTWFMWATELADHCGMHTWTTNSQTIRCAL